MEDTLILSTDNTKDEGEIVNEDEDMTPTVKSPVVLDWLDTIGSWKQSHCLHFRQGSGRTWTRL